LANFGVTPKTATSIGCLNIEGKCVLHTHAKNVIESRQIPKAAEAAKRNKS
jgi:hypothetical protein